MGKTNITGVIGFTPRAEGGFYVTLNGEGVVVAGREEPAWLTTDDERARAKAQKRLGTNRWCLAAVAEAHGGAAAAREAARAAKAAAKADKAEASGRVAVEESAIRALLATDGRCLAARVAAECSDWEHRSILKALAIEGAKAGGANRASVKAAFAAILEARAAAKAPATATDADTDAPRGRSEVPSAVEAAFEARFAALTAQMESLVALLAANTSPDK